MNGLAALLEARGLPSAYGCRQAIYRGASRLVRTKAADPESSARGFTSLADPVTMTTGWCLHDLEQPAERAAILGLVTALIRPDARSPPWPRAGWTMHTSSPVGSCSDARDPLRRDPPGSAGARPRAPPLAREPAGEPIEFGSTSSSAHPRTHPPPKDHRRADDAKDLHQLP